MMRALKSIARCILGEYDLYRIFATERSAATHAPQPLPMQFASVEAGTIELCEDELIRSQAWYAGAGSHAFACLVDGRIVGLCFFWHGARYRARNYWPLGADEAKLVQIVTAHDQRGKGVARSLIEYSTTHMIDRGYTRLFARVWYTNAPSTRAFRSAGWRQVACVMRVNPLRRAQPMRIIVGQRPTAAR